MTAQEVTLEDLARRVELLEDERDLTRLLSRYSFTADLRLADAWVGLWTEDGVYDLGSENVSSYNDRFEGHAALRELITGPGMPPEGASQHYVDGPITFEVDGDQATGVGYSFTFVRDTDGVHAWALGFNRWTFQRRDGTWKIHRRVRRELGSGQAGEVIDVPAR